MKPSNVTAFFGLNTKQDPLNLGLAWLTRADNIDITDRGSITTRPGYGAPIAATKPQAYATLDHQRAYYTDGDTLKSIDGATLATGLYPDPMYWAEVDRQVFYCNGTDSGIIDPDNTVKALSWPVPSSPTLTAVTGNLDTGLYRVVCTYVMPDGRETGASDPVQLEINDGQALQVSSVPQVAGLRTRTYICPANASTFHRAYGGNLTAFVWDQSPDYLGLEITTDGLDSLPAGATVIQHWNGRLHAAMYDASLGITFIFQSQPLAYHLFDLEKSIAVDGKVLMLAPADGALIIGTNKAISAYDKEGVLTVLASYGTVPGHPWSIDDETKQVWFWTERGTCQALPFKNLTDGHLSVAPGVQAGATVMQRDGQKRFVVALHAGGEPFNQRN